MTNIILKNIFITGGTSGIGLVAACELASLGHKVMATARSVERGHVEEIFQN